MVWHELRSRFLLRNLLAFLSSLQSTFQPGVQTTSV